MELAFFSSIFVSFLLLGSNLVAAPTKHKKGVTVLVHGTLMDLQSRDILKNILVKNPRA